MTHIISSKKLSISDIRSIIDNGEKLQLGEDARKAIVRCREYLDSKMEDIDHPVYGVTTGFGSLCNITIAADQLSRLQHNLVMSHACGTGDTVRPEIVRIMLLLKIQSLSYGHSGAQLQTVQRLVDMFNYDILPVVYQQGSLGASGDLAPLAHLCLPLIGMGEVVFKGERREVERLWPELGWNALTLKSKEGLALLNGTQFMTAHAVWSLMQADRLSEWADRIGAMSLDAFDGRIEPFFPQTHRVRPHKGQIRTAARFMELLEGSEIIRGKKSHVQDPYSFRCIPQVHGATKDTIEYVRSEKDSDANYDAVSFYYAYMLFLAGQYDRAISFGISLSEMDSEMKAIVESAGEISSELEAVKNCQQKINESYDAFMAIIRNAYINAGLVVDG